MMSSRFRADGALKPVPRLLQSRPDIIIRSEAERPEAREIGETVEPPVRFRCIVADTICRNAGDRAKIRNDVLDAMRISVADIDRAGLDVFRHQQLHNASKVLAVEEVARR